jgi:hypothetical protein
MEWKKLATESGGDDWSYMFLELSHASMVLEPAYCNAYAPKLVPESVGLTLTRRGPAQRGNGELGSPLAQASRWKRSQDLCLP